LVDSLTSLDGSGYVIDILRFDEGLQIVFKYLGEVVLELRSPKIL